MKKLHMDQKIVRYFLLLLKAELFVGMKKHSHEEGYTGANAFEE